MKFKHICAFLLFAAYCPSCWTADADSIWTVEKIVNVKQISDLQLSPDHQFAAYVVSEPSPDPNQDAFLSRIYISSIQDPTKTRLLCPPELATSQPRWSPDGQWIAFLSDRSGTNELFLISPQGTEAIPLTHVASSIETYRWSPDSHRIVFMMSENCTHDAANLSYIYKKERSINRLWMIDIANPQPKPLTNDEYYVRSASEFGNSFPEYDWSPDGKTIVFAYVPGSGCAHHYRTSSLAAIDLASGTITPWEKKESHESIPIFSPDGQWIAYLAGDGSLTLNRRIAIRSTDGKNFRLLASTDEGGIFYAGSSLLGWSQDGKSLLFFEPKGTKFQLMSVPLDGGPGQAMTFDDLVYDLSLSPDRKWLAFVLQNSTTAPEAYVTPLDAFHPIRVSDLNSAYAQLPTPLTEVIRWHSKDGLQIEGLITYPLDYQKEKKYPLLVDIHGGPAGFFCQDFIGNPYPYPYAMLAEAGFIILRPNPRGSCGYGIHFRHAVIEDLGGGDWEDIVAGVGAVIQRGIVDKERMGIMGWSYGGYLTAWAIGHTHLFKAASAGAGFCNLVSFDGTTDSHYILKDYLRGTFLEKEALYKKMSPLYYVANTTTPYLIQHGVLDQRVPVSQAYELYHALQGQGKVATLHLYPTMHHYPTTPLVHKAVMQANFEWFTDLLLSKETP